MNRDQLIFQVKNYIVKEGLVRPGETLLAGVSGGADSVCLLLILKELAEELGFSLRAVHVHHGLRETADGDQAYVQQLCADRGISLSCCRVDAAACAGQWGTGLEEAGRRLRYEVFENLRAQTEEQEGTACRIAVAHHMEDQAETVLFHLCRGTGLRGAGGMLPQNGHIIRPLLEVTRAEIENWLTGLRVCWRTDETNADTFYTRNFLRAEILPRLAAGVNPEAAAHIAGFAKQSSEAESYLAARTEEALNRCAVRGDRSLLSVSALSGEDPYMQGRVLYRCLSECAGTRRDLEKVHVEAIRKLCVGTESGRLSMPGGLTAVRAGDYLLFEKKGSRGLPLSYPLTAEDYTCELLELAGSPGPVPRKKYTKWFDYDKIGMFPVFRARQAGDRMTLLDTGAADGVIRKKLARVMLDGKIPSLIRDRIILPFAGQEALWIPGLRMGDAFRVGPETRRVLEISWEPGKDMCGTGSDGRQEK